MPNLDDVITDVLEREGRNTRTDHAHDHGGRTQYGVSERSHPTAWADNEVTEQEAREIFLSKYVVYPGYHRIPPSHEKIQAQLIDFAVLSGPYIATEKLQAILNVKVDGLFGPKSLAALIAADPRTINNQLAIERTKMVCRIVKKNPTQLTWLNGWVDRAVSFIY